MEEVSIVGVDLAKQVFQVHGAAADGRVLFRKKLSRLQFPKFMAALPPCVVAMEACGTAHYWGRELAGFGHDIRLIPPVYVKAFVKRQKNDAADAEAIAEAAMRPTMRTVAVKTSNQQARAMVFRTGDLLVGQRTQMVNALRGHLAEHGVIVGKGLGNVERLSTLVTSNNLPELVESMSRLYLRQIAQLHEEIDQIDRCIAAEARQSDVVQRLQKVPGIGPICAMAITAFAPSMEEFRSGRDFAAWLGLVPRQHSTGGKQKLGRTSKMGQRDIRRLLIIGAMSVVHWKGRGGGKPGSWLSNMLARKPRMLVAIAMANKMARVIWAMLARNEDYRDPTEAVC
ncbi:transposase IS116/IS110/IS902 family protein [Agrobacterium sp. ATCC 31749]|uniref:IS110 family transposase n=1 Tax=unclassified Agrobacterium TaxID=2632611 RepID=UPI00020DB875|nr:MULTISPECIES: IS110 family transposase [unclassified Agrobacterium]EGL64064.1 transposase IS116/IS110/IS902 family protein [Agrobacterium sp. ATCC 31749]QKX00266.1 IS110 family transposase [Agrobacterium sp. CGMCC 11546]